MKSILAALRRAPGFKLTHSPKHGMILGTAPGLLIRVIQQDDTHDAGYRERRWLIHIAQRKTFDRWANSTHFSTEAVWASRKAYAMNTTHWVMPDFAREFAWCRRVCRSGLFDFNTYIGTVSTPRFIDWKWGKV